MNPFDEFAALAADRGQQNYGKNVTIVQHSLLTAARGEPDTLVAACLMHDAGHWPDGPDDEFGVHTHDKLGGDWVAARLPRTMSEPVRLHVAAKRDLCSTDPACHDVLSPASQCTLTKQGGPMSATEVSEFAQGPFSDAVVRLRRIDGDE